MSCDLELANENEWCERKHFCCVTVRVYYHSLLAIGNFFPYFKYLSCGDFHELC